LSTLLVDFGVVSADEAAAGRLASAARTDLSSALRDFLGSLAALQATALLIVDDAHHLPDAVMHELRSLSDMGGSMKLLQIVLVGEPSLTRSLRSAELRGLDDRVALRAELGPLEEDELAGYVAHRLAVAGRGERVGFSEIALRRIFSLSRGVPGVVNQLCDRSLSLGYKVSASNIDADFVDEAAQQLGLAAAEASETWADRAKLVALMIGLMLVGAAGAGWVFHDSFARAFAHYLSR
jgi:general secretion pathway protein A